VLSCSAPHRRSPVDCGSVLLPVHPADRDPSRRTRRSTSTCCTQQIGVTIEQVHSKKKVPPATRLQRYFGIERIRPASEKGGTRCAVPPDACSSYAFVNPPRCFSSDRPQPPDGNRILHAPEGGRGKGMNIALSSWLDMTTPEENIRNMLAL
jgi:hypothetical protein